MKFFLTLFLLFMTALTAFSDLKEEIMICEEQVFKEKSPDPLHLVKLYYQDQQQQKAFDLFLEVLEHNPSNPMLKRDVSPEEQSYYDGALQIYLNPLLNAQEAARQILSQYKEIQQSHPDYLMLGFLIATSHANLLQFENFFEQFYRSYQAHPQHYLAYKTLSSLYVRLYERQPPGEQKERYRKKIIDQLVQARDSNPADINLYKLIVVFSANREKQASVCEGLNKIIDKHIVIPRGEIIYFVLQALNHDQPELAQRFLDEMKRYHQYSRSIIQAQKLIDEKKNKGKIE